MDKESIINKKNQDSKSSRTKFKEEKGHSLTPGKREKEGEENNDALSDKESNDESTQILKHGPEGKTEIPSSSEADINEEERKLIDQAFSDEAPGQSPEQNISLDEEDADGEPLNEKGPKEDLFGEDLDTPLIKEESEEGE